MILFRFIFAILISPFRWITNIFKHKDNVLEWHFNYGPSFVKVQTKYKEQFLADDLLIASYILFLARYFYICDDRQINIIKDSLLNSVKESEKPKEITVKFYKSIFHTLSQAEQNAVAALFRPFSFLPTPPLTYSENEEPKHSFAKYSFLIFKIGNQLVANFHMSYGPDIILLPLTCGILYEYITNTIRNKDKKEKLDQSIIDLLEAYKFIDCRSFEGLRELPVKIINKNNLNY
ncbi:MAG: hypothetical protein PHN74_00385 [Candidatus Pacebacteria bacterium]|nr:hypothetical protein [Candidatus Paceibacterota bacterium]